MEPEEDLQLNFDWNLCIICQETTNECLQCPASEIHRQKDIGSGYVTLAENRQAFSELGIDTPVIKSFKNLETLPACLLENQGNWHKSCHLRFNSTKFQRLRKGHLRLQKMTKITRENQYEGQMSRTEKFPEKCFFDCGDELNKQALHLVTTLSVDCRVRKIATETNDTTVLAKLSQGDMIVIEAHYHTKCLISYHNKSRTKNEEHQRNPNAVLYGVALAEIVAFVEEQRIESEITVFKLADLIKMYSNRLEELGLETGNRINSTHFKKKNDCYLLVRI